jgi:uncharacterized protein involved in exopolysaccharide biosynthesis
MNPDASPAMASSAEPVRTSGGDGDFIDFLAWIWLKKVTFVVVTAVFVVLAVVNALMAPVVYTAQVTMLPQNVSSKSDFLGQVQSFTGISFNNEVSFEQLYGEILFSDRILDKAISHRWRHRDFTGDVSLFEIFEIADVDSEGDPSARATADLKTLLRTGILSFYRDDWTGYMTLKVTVPRDPSLAADIANFLARELDNFNRSFRTQRAKAQTEFIKTRLSEVESELELASDALTAFITANRSYRTSPALIQMYDELDREVDAQTSIWIELRRQLELAKIDVNKEMASINVLDIASVPTKKSGPNRTFRVAVGLVIGVIFSFLMLLGFELFYRVRLRFRREDAGISITSNR